MTSKPLPKDQKHTTLDDTKDLNDKTMKELKSIAKELKMKQYSKLTKQPLIDAIINTNDNYYDGAKNKEVIGKKKMDDKEKNVASQSKKMVGKTITPKEKEVKATKAKKSTPKTESIDIKKDITKK